MITTEQKYELIKIFGYTIMYTELCGGGFCALLPGETELIHDAREDGSVEHSNHFEYGNIWVWHNEEAIVDRLVFELSGDVMSFYNLSSEDWDGCIFATQEALLKAFKKMMEVDAEQANTKATLVLTLKVSYKPNGVHVGDLRDNLRNLCERAIGDGMLTGETAAEVAEYSMDVEEVDIADPEADTVGLWTVDVSRTGYGRTISFQMQSSMTKKEAEALAIDQAGNESFSEHSSEYDVQAVYLTK